jgi:hypothetical protein
VDKSGEMGREEGMEGRDGRRLDSWRAAQVALAARRMGERSGTTPEEEKADESDVEREAREVLTATGTSGMVLTTAATALSAPGLPLEEACLRLNFKLKATNVRLLMHAGLRGGECAKLQLAHGCACVLRCTISDMLHASMSTARVCNSCIQSVVHIAYHRLYKEGLNFRKLRRTQGHRTESK